MGHAASGSFFVSCGGGCSGKQDLILLLCLVLALVIPAPAAAANRGIFTFAQLKYEGDWDPNPTAAKEFLNELVLRTSVEVNFERQVVTLRDKTLFSFPFLYVTGRRALPVLKDNESEALRNYLTSGGIIFFDDGLGFAGNEFRQSVERELKRVLPDREIKKIPESSALYRSFYLIGSAGGRRLYKPYLEGLELEKRYVVIYCSNDLGSVFVKDRLGNWLYECSPGGELQRKEGVKLFLNILMYALTGTYKEDLIHQNSIRKKLKEAGK